MSEGHGDEDRGGRGFTVVDRRGSSEGGEPGGDQRPPEAESPEQGDPRVDFATFVLSLATSALYHLGLVGDPESGKTGEPNLPLARQTIDTIEMLQKKTRGNLDEQESRLLEDALYQLHMRFVEASQAKARE